MLGRSRRCRPSMISRRLSSANAEFGGIASVTVSRPISTITGRVRAAERGPGRPDVGLRRSGHRAISSAAGWLSFFPSTSWPSIRRCGPPPRQACIRSSPGRERTGAFRRIDGMPLYINVSMPEDAYWGPWTVQMRLYGAFALIALVALLALTTLASEQFSRAGRQCGASATRGILADERGARLRRWKSSTGRAGRSRRNSISSASSRMSSMPGSS